MYIHRTALLTLGTLHWLRSCMVAQLHALRAQQNKHLLNVEFSQREHCPGISVYTQLKHVDDETLQKASDTKTLQRHMSGS